MRGSAKTEHFGMCGRITKTDLGIAALGDDAVVSNDERTNRNFTLLSSYLRQFDTSAHVLYVGHKKGGEITPRLQPFGA